MAGLRIHREAAGPGVLSALDALGAALSGRDFYMAGGTALALFEGHRISVDVDLFSKEMKDPESLLRTLESDLDGIENAAVGRGALSLILAGVRIDLIAYRYPLLERPVEVCDHWLPLASRDDIAAMKLAALTARGARKDFIDLWTLLTRRNTLEHYLEAFEAKYSNRDLGHVLRSLTYFDDAEDEPWPQLIVPVDWEGLKEDFRTWVRALLPQGPE